MGTQVVGNTKNAPGSVFDYMDLMFANQDSIHEFADTANDTMLVDHITSILASSQVFSKFADTFKKGMSDGNMDWFARVDWKFGCSIGTSGTPFPYINRVFLDDSISEYSLADWQKLIDPMLGDDNNVL